MQYIYKTQMEMSQAERAALFDLAREHCLEKIVFFDGVISDRESWLHVTQSENIWVIRCDDAEGKTLGFYWANGLMNKTAAVHMCLWCEVKTAIAVTKGVLQFFYELTGMESVFVLAPAVYRHLVPFCDAVGFSESLVIPGALYMAHREKIVPARMLVHARRK